MCQNIGQGNALGLGNVGGFGIIGYWSSSEYDSNYVLNRNFDPCASGLRVKLYTNYVRAVRAF
tara:strand:+ start:85064 stop:85252 length:189 start_codon:yes stop_codon:yes gene_type:complete